MARLKETTYARLTELLARKGRAVIGHNTVAEKDGDAVSVFYHGNFIVRLWPDCAEFTLAGWGTPTTRDRVNQLISAHGARVSQKDFVQYLQQGDGPHVAICSDERFIVGT